MTLSDITLPITYEWGRAHALLFSPQRMTLYASITTRFDLHII